MAPPDKMRSQIAALESKVDLLESEITHLDAILRKCGFPSGILTLKATVEEILKEANGSELPEDPFSMI